MSSYILVIGGAGYIGSHITKELLDAGYKPVVFDNLSTGKKENLLESVPFIYGDVLVSHEIEKALSGIDAVIHLAALKAAGESMVMPEKYAFQNIAGSIHLLNAMSNQGVKKLVFSSTASVYGMPEYNPMDEKHPTNPINFYGFTKLEVERLLSWYATLNKIEFISLRYFNAAGYDPSGRIRGLENNPNNLFPIVMEALTKKRDKIEVFGDQYPTKDGSCIRDYIHVSDLAIAHVKALEKLNSGVKNEIFNLGTSFGFSVFEVIEAVEKISNKHIQVEITGKREGDAPILLADATKANKQLNWKTKWSDLETIIKTMLEVYSQ